MADLAGASVKSVTPFKLYRKLSFHGGANVQTITGPVTITALHGDIQLINGGASTRVVTLPTVASGAKSGMIFVILNTGSTNSLTVNRPTSTLVVTLTAGQSCMVVHDGTIWRLAMFSGT